MNVVIVIGKKQFFLKKGDVFFVNKINGLIHNIIEFNSIILFKNGTYVECGTPFINNITVLTKLISIKQTKKINVIKFKRRNNYFKKQGHRQIVMEFLVLDIQYKGLLNGT